MPNTAQEIAQALDANAKREGPNYATKCPLCNRRMTLRDSSRGRLLATCWGGCSGADVIHELKRAGYLSGPISPKTADEIIRDTAADEAKRRRETAKAKTLWDEGMSVLDTVADTYLRSRGIDIESPFLDASVAKAVRFHSRCEHERGVIRPALLARIDHLENGFVAVSRTYLSVDGLGKAALNPPRKFLGPVAGGAIRFSEPKSGEWLVVGEGIETTLSVMQSTELPGWAALSANGIRNLRLPPEADRVMICADNDLNGVGQRHAHDAAERFVREGRRVKISLPPIGYDFNDVLMGRVADVGEAANG